MIDPPWSLTGFSVDKSNHSKYGTSLPYDTMTDEEISNFPIDNYADNDGCDLFMWTVYSKLELAFEIIHKWKFKFHCPITWNKQAGVSMNGFDRRTELCLYSYRGKMNIKKDKGPYIPTIINESRTHHSAKPRLFYSILLKSTQEPRIDIFSRKKHIGFDSWGNQAEEPLTITSFVTKEDSNEK